MYRNRYIFPFFLALLFSCRTPDILKPTNEEIQIYRGRPVSVTSSDPVVTKLLCERLLCGPGPQLEVELIIKDSSSDLLLNNVLSLLTLSTGTFVSHSANVEYQINLESIDNSYFSSNSGQNPRSQTGSIFVRDRIWTLMPFYVGLGATNVGTMLNTYRDPLHLKQYCIDEEPGSIRRFFDGNQNEICTEYYRFVSLALNQLWPSIDGLVTSIPEFPNFRRYQEGALP